MPLTLPEALAQVADHKPGATECVLARAEAQDRQTYTEVRQALAEGRELTRDFTTGELVPPSLKGCLYGAGDLHASAFARIDASVEALFVKARPASEETPINPIQHAAE